MLYWQIGMVLLVANIYTLSLLAGASYRHSLFGAGIAAAAATFGAAAMVAAELPEPGADPFLIRKARHAVCGLIAASSAAAMAFFLMMPWVAFVGFAIAAVFATLACWMAYEVVRGATADNQLFPTGKFIIALTGTITEILLLCIILAPNTKL